MSITQKNSFELKACLWQIWLLLLTGYTETLPKSIFYITSIKNMTQDKIIMFLFFPWNQECLSPLQAKSSPDSSGFLPCQGFVRDLQRAVITSTCKIKKNLFGFTQNELRCDHSYHPFLGKRGKREGEVDTCLGLAPAKSWGLLLQVSPCKAKCDNLGWKCPFFVSSFLFLTYIMCACK